MKISRTGDNYVVQFTDQGQICANCNHIFRRFHILSDVPVAKCPKCGSAGPFRIATKADIAAYVERQQPKGPLWRVLNRIALIAVAIASVVTIIRAFTG